MEEDNWRKGKKKLFCSLVFSL